MIAVDTNLLVYALREDSPFHGSALAVLTELAMSGRRWAIPWPCVHEFIAISTHPKIILDMENLSVTDIKKEKDRKKLEGHLKSGDFFHVTVHPTATFELKEHKDGNLTGTLTIRGVARDAVIPATLAKNDEGDWELTADFTFNRQDFDVNYQNSGFFGTAKDKLIRDNVDVAVKLVFSL